MLVLPYPMLTSSFSTQVLLFIKSLRRVKSVHSMSLKYSFSTFSTASRSLKRRNIIQTIHTETVLSMNNKLHAIQRMSIFNQQGPTRFPHVIRYPKDYYPTPKGYEYVADKIKRQIRLTEDEKNVMQIHWGLDAMGLLIFSSVIIIGSVFFALYPSRLRSERIDHQVMQNWLSENAEYLQGSIAEDLVAKFARFEEEPIVENDEKSVENIEGDDDVYGNDDMKSVPYHKLKTLPIQQVV